MLTMERESTLLFKPNYITLMPPGNVLEEKIEEMGLNAEELAEKTGLPIATIHAILKAEMAMTQEIAEALERITLIPRHHWFRYEEIYQKKMMFIKENPTATYYPH